MHTYSKNEYLDRNGSYARVDIVVMMLIDCLTGKISPINGQCQHRHKYAHLRHGAEVEK